MQPTAFCNLDCSYCYLPHRNDKRRMSMATLAAVFEDLFTSRFLGDRLTVVWHAGEPLVLPPAYYAEAFQAIERLRPPGLILDHSFQSNGTLLNDTWVDFIKTRQIRVG
ncbi:MAG TPA: radical SAM protein, partial [Kiloniellaceae bacterium]|nr:radical SAM protein [Kiloniellaceae bacterium]